MISLVGGYSTGLYSVFFVFVDGQVVAVIHNFLLGNKERFFRAGAVFLGVQIF